MTWSLFDNRGRRKYLVASERQAFLSAAFAKGSGIGTFCAVLALCGPRISEALALTPERIDRAAGIITFETLKRRKRGVMRSVPAPAELLIFLERVHCITASAADSAQANIRIWPQSRTSAWRHVKAVMAEAGIPEYLQQPKALRHAFGASAANNLVVLTLIQKWLGHAKLETTEHYTHLVGREERLLAKRTWREVSRAFMNSRPPASGS